MSALKLPSDTHKKKSNNSATKISELNIKDSFFPHMEKNIIIIVYIYISAGR